MVDLIDLHKDKVLVKLAFERRGVFAWDHGVSIELEQSARVA